MISKGFKQIKKSFFFLIKCLKSNHLWSFVLLICVTCLLPNLTNAAVNHNITGQPCEAQITLIRITKEEYDPVNQALMRVCEGEIRVNKCEGKCQSSLQPSFNSPTGFLKVNQLFFHSK